MSGGRCDGNRRRRDDSPVSNMSDEERGGTAGGDLEILGQTISPRSWAEMRS
jgi:hypothetical protein